MALRLQSLTVTTLVRNCSLWLSIASDTIPSCSHDHVCRRGHSSGTPAAATAAWEESVEIETDHSLAHRVQQAMIEYKVRKAAPDWLPFLPGGSYWIPPEPETKVKVEEVPIVRLDLSEEEILSFLAPTGWPASSLPGKASSVQKKKRNKKKKT